MRSAGVTWPRQAAASCSCEHSFKEGRQAWPVQHTCHIDKRSRPRRHLCRHGLISVLLLSCVHPSLGSWMSETRELRAADSVRIRAIPWMATTAWGSGSSNDPVALRSTEYRFATQAPYEWFLKFNLQPYKGRMVNAAKLVVSKCAASHACQTHCSFAGTCSCPTNQFVDASSCGGGNIDEMYDKSSDDLHAWHISNNWTSSWNFEDWAQTWNRQNRSGVESCCSRGTGGDSKMHQAIYLGGVDEIGKAGTAMIEVVTALGSEDPSSSEETGLRYVISQDYVSLRLTVNGTDARFFVPAGGDFVYAPRLVLGFVYSTTTTTTTVTSSQKSSTHFMTSTRRQPTVQTSIQSGPHPGWEDSTTQSSSTSSTTMPGLVQTSTTASSSQPRVTTTTFLATSFPSAPPSSSSMFISTRASTSTLLPTSSSGMVLAITPAATTAEDSTTRLSPAETSTSTTTTQTSMTSTVASIDVMATHVFSLQTADDVDAAAAITSSSFRSSCQRSVAEASGRSKEKIEIVGIDHEAGRRLEDLAGKSKITLRYRMPVTSSADQADLVSALQSPQFSEGFGQQLTLAEKAHPDGLSIASLDFVRMTTKSSSFLGPSGNDTWKYNRESMGKVIFVYGNPLWKNKDLVSWAGNATPAIQIALVKILATTSVPHSQQKVFVSPGRVSTTSSYVKARFVIHAQVPPIEVALDPDGSMYRERFQSYSQVMEELDSSETFQETVVHELEASGVPAMPGMAFVAHESVETSEDTHVAGSSIKIVLLVLFSVMSIVFIGTCTWKKRPQLTFMCCVFIKPQASPKFDAKTADTCDNKVRPFHDDGCEPSVCTCGNQVKPDADYCSKCGRRVVGLEDVKLRSPTNALCQLKLALQELGEASKSIANDFKLMSPKAMSVRNTTHRSSVTGIDELPHLVDEYKYARKLDYTDRPGAARHNLYNLGDEYEAARRSRGRLEASPASTCATHVSNGASFFDVASPPDSTWSSPSPDRIRPSTRRTSPAAKPSRSHGSLSNEIEIIDVTDTESEDSTPGKMKALGEFEFGQLASRSLPNWTSCRIFRRTMASHVVAEESGTHPRMSREGSYPCRSNDVHVLSGEDATVHSGQSRMKNVHGPSQAANCTAGSDRLEVVQVIDL